MTSNNLNKELEKLNVAAAIKKAVDAFKEQHAAKSFSGRHPELGKMIKCQVCSRRHRSIHVCEQRFVKELTPPEGLTDLTKFQVFGRANFKGKRTKPHYSKKRLQLLQRTIELYPHHQNIWPSTETKSAELVTMQMARREARLGLEAERTAKRAKVQAAQHRSRRVNRGLLEGNSRVVR